MFIRLIFCVAISSVTVVSCQNAPADQRTDTSSIHQDTLQTPAATATCFRHTLQRDTTEVMLTMAAAEVTGTMHWNPWQKDGAKGTLRGTKNGDTLRLLFDYMIEGMNQKEEKVFVYTRNTLYELQAPLTEKNGVLMAEPGAAFTVATTFIETPCTPAHH